MFVLTIVADVAIVNGWWPVVVTLVFTLLASAVALWHQERTGTTVS